jgi:hypothetical protein
MRIIRVLDTVREPIEDVGGVFTTVLRVPQDATFEMTLETQTKMGNHKSHGKIVLRAA